MNVETIEHNNKKIAIIIKSGLTDFPDKTTFITNPNCDIQAGYVVYPKNGKINKHIHTQIKRDIIGTNEILIVTKGECIIEFYSDKSANHQYITTKTIVKNDILILIDKECGHSYCMTEDTVLFEIKQGPYFGDNEKQYI